MVALSVLEAEGLQLIVSNDSMISSQSEAQHREQLENNPPPSLFRT